MICQCKHLRTKTAYAADAGQPHAWRTDESTTAHYWCLKTMITAGPDNGLVAPEQCTEDRRCFESVDIPV